jgi:DUF2946 family protein
LSEQVDGLMRRRLRKFLPIVLIALAVQIFAPIAACWAASIAVSDPLRGAMICHDSTASTSGHDDQGGQGGAHDGCCSICSVAHGAAPLATPQFVVAALHRDSVRVVWITPAPDLSGSRTGSQAQARAPPQLT